MTTVKVQFRSLTAFELHKRLINNYILSKQGATKLFSCNKTHKVYDIDIIKENHRFLWEGENVPKTWEEELAKKYYDKLFKEYCISDLSRYKENMVALRWRTEQEVLNGKGQFICGNKKCDKKDLKTWEVNFGYIENEQKKNALVKLRLCPECSIKLNYRSKKREIKRNKCKRKRASPDDDDDDDGNLICNNDKKLCIETSENNETEKQNNAELNILSEDETIWSKPCEQVIEKSRADEFEEFLEELLL